MKTSCQQNLKPTEVWLQPDRRLATNQLMNFRKGTINDLDRLKELGLKSWSPYQENLYTKHWKQLYGTVNNANTYAELLNTAESLVCETEAKEVVAMAFLVPNGNPNEIYDEEWCHLRFVSVDPDFQGKGIGKELTRKCIELARANRESVMALHTAEIMEGARHIYEKVGFKLLKEIAPSLGVRYWLYTLALNEVENTRLDKPKAN